MQVAKPKKGYKLVKTSFGKYEEIPEEWKLSTLQDICDTTSGGTPLTTNPEYYDGEIPWLTTSELQDNFVSKTKNKITEAGFKNSSAKKIPPNSIIIAMYGATIGKTCINTKEITTNQACCVFIPKKEKLVDPYFLQQVLIYFRPLIVSLGQGAGQPNISQDFLRKFQIPFPLYQEQQKITSILSNVDSTIQKTNQIIEQTQRFKKGMMQKLLTRGIGHTKFKKTKIGKIPEEWEIVILKELGEWNGGGTPSKSNKKFWTNGSIPWITPKDMKTDEIYDSIDKITPGAIEKSVGKIIKSNSILFVVRSGIIQKILPIAITKVDVTINQDMKALTVRKEVNSSYIFHTVQSLSDDIRYSCSKGGTTVQSIVVPQLLKYSIPLPPLSEQKQITSILSNVDTQIQKEKLHKSNLERLKKGLMQKLLTGQIRVKVR